MSLNYDGIAEANYRSYNPPAGINRSFMYSARNHALEPGVLPQAEFIQSNAGQHDFLSGVGATWQPND